MEQKICYLNKPAKGSNPKMFKMSNRLTTMIAPYMSKTPRKEQYGRGS